MKLAMEIGHVIRHLTLSRISSEWLVLSEIILALQSWSWSGKFARPRHGKQYQGQDLPLQDQDSPTQHQDQDINT